MQMAGCHSPSVQGHAHSGNKELDAMGNVLICLLKFSWKSPAFPKHEKRFIIAKAFHKDMKIPIMQIS